MADSNISSASATSQISIYDALPDDVRLLLMETLFQDSRIQVMPHHLHVRESNGRISREVDKTRIARNTQETCIIRTVNGTDQLLEDYGLHRGYRKFQLEISDLWDLSNRSTYNSDLESLHYAATMLGRDALEEVAHQGVPLQIWGYGIGDEAKFLASASEDGFWRNTTKLILSPTIFHTLDYRSTLQSLPNLKMIFIDPIVIKFWRSAVRFSTKGFRAGCQLNCPAAKMRLQIAAERFFPRNLSGPGVPDALVVRQIIWSNGRVDRANCLDTVFAQRISSTAQEGRLPKLIWCRSFSGVDPVANASRLYDENSIIPLLGDGNIEQITGEERSADSYSHQELGALYNDYAEIAPNPSAEHDYRNFLDGDNVFEGHLRIYYHVKNMGDSNIGI